MTGDGYRAIRLPAHLLDRVAEFQGDESLGHGFTSVPEVVKAAIRAFLGDDHLDLPVTRKELRAIFERAHDANPNAGIEAILSAADDIIPRDGG